MVGQTVSRKPIANPLLDVDGYIDPVNLINPYAYATGGGAFDPLSISGCVLWLKADGSCYNTGTTQATDGQTVETWVDESATTATVTQATSGSRPTFKTNIVNGKPVLRFDGSDDYFPVTISGLSSSSGLTCFFVSIKDADPPAYNQAAAPVNGFTSLSTAWNAHIPFSNGLTYLSMGTDTRKDAITLTKAVNVWRVMSLRSASASYALYIDGTSDYSTGTNTVGIGDTANIGASAAYPGSTDFRFDGDIAEILLYNSALSTGDREAVEDYLGTKYGVTITH